MFIEFIRNQGLRPFILNYDVEKTLIYFFSTFGSKLNEFEQKELEKTKKNSKNLAGNYPNVISCSFF